jgi:hypothetical protein
MPAEASLRLRNTGEGVVRARLWLDPPDGPFFLLVSEVSADGGGTNIPVQLLSFDPGVFEGKLHLETSGAEPQQFTVQLTGVVVALPDCNDGNPCTVDVLQERECVYTPRVGPCDDDNACTDNDTCVNAVCQGSARECADSVDCTVDSCDPEVGCVNIPRAESCNDGRVCTVDACVPLLGCTNVVSPDGTLCGVPSCTDLSVCIGGSCEEYVTPNGFPCEDGDPCTLGDACQTGHCQAGVGEPMGVGDPIAVAVEGYVAGDVPIVPVAVAGIQALGNDAFRTVWRSAPVGWEACPAGTCDPSLAECDSQVRTTTGGFSARITDMDIHGGVLAEMEVQPLRARHAVVAVRAAPVHDGIMVALMTHQRPACCLLGECAVFHQDQPSEVRVELVKVLANGDVVASSTVDLFLKPANVSATDLELALGTVGSTVVLVHTRVESVAELVVSRLSVDSTLVIEEQEALPLVPENLPVESGVAVDHERLTVAWRQSGNTQAEASVCLQDELSSTEVWIFDALANDVAGGSLRRAQPAESSTVSVAVASAPPGPVVFTAHREVQSASPLDGGCPIGEPCHVCVLEQRWLAERGTSNEVLLDEMTDDPGNRIVRLGAGVVWGRVIGAAMRENGGISLLAPASGGTPALSAEFIPPANVPLKVNPDSPPVLAPDGARAFLGALFDVAVGETHISAVAVTPAGCGLQAQGIIKGLPLPVDSHDAGIPMDAGGVDGAHADGGAVDDAAAVGDGGINSDGGLG